MKKSAWVLLVLLLAACAPTLACTSFAVYSEQAWYGMNFDYGKIGFGLAILEENGGKVFVMAFQDGGDYSVTVGMNEDGFFASGQLLYHRGKIAAVEPDADTITLNQLFWDSLCRMDRVDRVREIAAKKRLIEANPYRSTHFLFADPTGDAVVVEAFGGKEKVTESENGILVMTNFPNGDFAGQGYKEVEGIGADRYIAAYEMIAKTKDAFDLQKALAVLQATVQPGMTVYPTLCSMVFDPVHGRVYVVLYRDFRRIWRVTLATGLIETYAGFTERKSMPLGADGIMAERLME